MDILLVDDDRDSRVCVGEFLRELGHAVEECSDGRQALALAANGQFSLVLSDINMPQMTGLELLRALKALPGGAYTDVVLFTGYGDMSSAISALRAGAYDYLLKPINVEELATLTDRIAEHHALRRENKILTERFDEELRAATAQTQVELQELKRQVCQAFGIGEVIFSSNSMRQIVMAAQKYHTDRSIPVLIQGETGTGKEVIARMIHFGDGDNGTPFIDVNCAALTASLFESELFGYEAGAFTGSLSRGQKGKLDLAQGGTIFLDEVGEIPLELQGKLLRVIQEKEFYRVGGLKKIQTDVRIICATNIDLAQRVQEGSFRRDLYYRLKVGHLMLLPLRERKEDIWPLASMFLAKFAGMKRKKFQCIGSEAANVLLHYQWPGNVRELQNAIEWSVFMYDDVELRTEHLQLAPQSLTASQFQGGSAGNILNPDLFELPAAGFDLDQFMQRIVDKALVKHGGNKAETARYLGISRRSLYSRLESAGK
jgi:DNA-binding NtrC family response regulator